MKKLALVLIATALGATAASAQTTIIRRHGDDMGDRVVVKHRGFDGDRVIHRRVMRGPDRVVIRRGGPDCRMVTVRRTNARGDTVIRKTRRCD